jgi:hypothetical protein
MAGNLAIYECELCGIVFQNGSGNDGEVSSCNATFAVNSTPSGVALNTLCITCAAALKTALDDEVTALTAVATGTSMAHAIAAVPNP